MTTATARIERAPAVRAHAGRTASLLAAFRPDRALSWRELGLAWGALLLAGTLVFLPHIRHGGFYLDDWSNAALTLQTHNGTDFGTVISNYADLTLFRPVLVIYVPLTYWVFGMHMWMHLAWAALLAVSVSALLYAVLRTLGVPWIHALAISALILLFPWFDSTRLWAIADQISLASALALGGLWLALTGLARDSWRWHAAAALLFLLSIFTYEITLPVIAAFGLLYAWRFGWRRARWRWALDIGVCIVAGVWVLSHTARTTGGLSDHWHHLRMIFDGGVEVFARSALPVGPQRTALPLIALGLVFLLGAVSLWRWPQRFAGRGENRMGLGRWLGLGATGLAVMALGWVVFVPADPYYVPSIYGITNRVNGVAGIGLVLVVYAGFGVIGTLLAQALRRRRVAFAIGVTLALGLLLGAGYLTAIRRHIAIWNSAYQAERTAIAEIKAKYPSLPRWNTLYVTGYPSYQTLGVPILSSSWDLDGMVKAEYHDGTLSARPLLYGYAFACEPDGIRMRASSPAAPQDPQMVKLRRYGESQILDLETGRRFAPRNQAECKAVTKGLEPGALYLSSEY